MKTLNELVRLATLGALMTIAGTVAAQQDYPGKPIRMIVPFPPGGANTTLARIVGQKLTEGWGQQVIVDNRGGANTIIGTEVLVKSPPDGYTFILISSAHVINPLLLPSLPYDTIKDFAPVATIVSTEQVLVLHPSVPAGNLPEFIALAKSRPGQLNYATPGAGGPSHLAAETFCILTGVRMQHIPYKGAGQSMTDLIGGQVQLSFSNPINVVAHIKSGKVKGLAISGATRSSVLPQVPTFAEAGLPGFEAGFWQGILAPAGTPKAIVEKISSEIARILRMPDIKEKLLGQGQETFYSTPEQFGALMKADMAKYARVIREANIKLEN